MVGFWLRSLESAKTECPFFDWIKEVLPDLSDEIDSCYQLIDSRIKKMRSDLRFQFSNLPMMKIIKLFGNRLQRKTTTDANEQIIKINLERNPHVCTAPATPCAQR